MQCSFLLVCGLGLWGCSPASLPLPIAEAQEESEGLPAEQTQVIELVPAVADTEAPPADCLTAGPRRLRIGQGDEVVSGDAGLPLVALTFDAGAAAGAANQLLDVLSSRGVHSTFFITGAFADRYPDLIARIAADGHELANHSYSHPDFRKLTENQMRVEIRRAAASIEAASGSAPTLLWRPPFGSRDKRILQVVDDEGYRPIYWTLDSGDWLDGATEQKVRSTVLSKAGAGAIVVGHISPDATARAMPAIIDGLRDQGFALVTVSQLLGEAPVCPAPPY
ncbi:MAG TPA: polysaccharide deacetylase family protein [Chloroflexota bacterium]